MRANSWEVDVVAWYECIAGCYYTTVVGIKAVCDCIFQDILVPTIDEVSVEAITGRIAIGEHKSATGLLIDVIGPIQNSVHVS